MGCQKGVLDLNMFFISNLWPLQALDKGGEKNISLQKGLRLVGLLELTRGKTAFLSQRKGKKGWFTWGLHITAMKKNNFATNPIGMS